MNAENTARGQWPSTHRSLLARVRQPENAEAWREFVSLYEPLLHTYCRRRGLQDACQQDVVQDILWQVQRSISVFVYDPQRGRFRGWLGTIASRAVGRYYAAQNTRQMSPAEESDLADQHGTVDPLWLDEFQSLARETALARIQNEFSTEVWQAFVLTWVEEMPIAEVVEKLGRQPDWIYRAKYLALTRLKEEVARLAEDWPASGWNPKLGSSDEEG